MTKSIQYTTLKLNFIEYIAGTGSLSSIKYLTVFNGKIYFTATDATYGNELYVCNVDTSTISLLKDLRTGVSHSSPANLTVFNNNLYFSANDGSTGAELWSYDGTTDPILPQYGLISQN